MTRKKVNLIHSPQVYYEQNQGTHFIPIWAYTLSAYIPTDWDVKIFDLSCHPDISIPPADVFAFSGINQDFPSIQMAFQKLKTIYPQSVFVLGGPIVWSFEKDGRLGQLDFFDHLFVLDGEETFPQFLQQLGRENSPKPEKIIRTERFSVEKAKKMRFDLLKQDADQYYGGVVEVSRGCPFLCEFCDIRVLPQNNEAHNKQVDLIIEELDAYYRLGIRQIQLACDNFIGDPVWADHCVDAILAWVQKTGARVALYTWLTVNISKFPNLMIKMRKAGFNSLFIGVESFNANSILETAKVQNHNDKNEMIEALKHIQSFGFLVVPGLIFGFDNDRRSLFEDTLDGVLQSGLLGGDPTFLLALPGTPLYERMKRTGRLIEYHEGSDMVPLHKERVSKIETNIRYVQPHEFLVRGFMQFIKKFNDADYVYQRFERHVSLMMTSEHFIPSHSVGYGNLGQYLKFQFSSWSNFQKMFSRGFLFLHPRRFVTVLKGLWLVTRYFPKYPGLKNHFSIWLFFWSNLLIKYRDLKMEDFKIHSIDQGYDVEKIWNDSNYIDTTLLASGRNPDNVKVADQSKRTKEAMARLRQNLNGKHPADYFSKKAS